MTKPNPSTRIPLAVFIGMPGSGKTRIGRELAGILKVPFKDSDIEIEMQESETVTDIFENRGEQEFRAIEAGLIINRLSGFDGVLSLGGGAPMSASVAEALRRYVAAGGMVVLLDADPREAISRASRSGNRPLLAKDAAARWRRLAEERMPVFTDVASLVVTTKGFSPMEVAQRIEDELYEHKVHVGGQNPYDVVIGNGVLEQLPSVVGEKVHKVALIHTDPVRVHSDRALDLLNEAGYKVTDITIPDAEEGKTVDVMASIWHTLGEEGFTRSDAIVGLGGGAATDVAGFAAATWMRGIRYVNCPTSLLAMVDASTGGKTGINTELGKNLVGSFYTPAGVLADMTTLSTLPNDIFVEGLGEVAKSGFIMDTHILDLLESHSRVLRDFDPQNLTPAQHAVIADLIRRTVTVKSAHVTADLKEAGKREFLNYGHTLAHAIEQIEHFTWRHGQAVAVGMVFAAELSHLTGHIDSETVDYHRRLLSSLGLRTSWQGGSFDEVLALMHRDKKARGNKLRFIILESVGVPIHLDDPPLDAVREAFERIRH
ncbi:MAG: bifunctional shikimate kinase/3-dehydroquinate synthase [Bifidobacteriaceae bacterium]|jgi:shikimate kinase/3-dehydroquinate synthase|nr:bifunctional shikimate kinase/3-dehydroquinate synthase [Bifidobacteriaceae bacterium]MCI1978588.1 bifunctional shikimate kinase/3-dehydroquinate synthase [Bifidobacteriaceae bacterium]